MEIRGFTALLVTVGVAACSGSIGGGATAPDPGPSPTQSGRGDTRPGGGAGMSGTSPQPDPGTTTPITAPVGGAECRGGGAPYTLRRLTRFEYENTVRDLLGFEPGVAKALPDDVSGTDRFDNFPALQSSSDLHAERYEDAARSLAVRAVANLDALLACAAGTNEETCGCQFTARFARRAFRRPLEAEEETRLCAFFKKERVAFGMKDAVEQVVTAVLQAPHFLYRVEAGAPGTRLSGHELAVRLSYLLTGTMPDDRLRAAADRKELETAAQVRAEAERLLGDPRARPAIGRFFEQWLELGTLSEIEKDKQAYPKFAETLVPLWQAETTAFVEDVVFGGGKFEALFDAKHTFLNKTLAQFYGHATVPASSTKWEKVSVPPGDRSGVLGHASFLATHAHHNQTSPIERGLFVRRALLCGTLASPPDNAEIKIPEPRPGITTRQRFEMHSTAPACAACHRLIDPIGVGFEKLDAIGLARTHEDMLPIDTRGELLSTDVDGRFDGAVELGARLAKSAQVRACFVNNLFQYAFARHPEEADACVLTALGDALAKGGNDVRQLILALTGTPTFLNRAGAR